MSLQCAVDGVAAIAAAVCSVHGRNILYMLNGGRWGVCVSAIGGGAALGLHLVDRKLDKLPSTKEMHEMCMECIVSVVTVCACVCGCADNCNV